MALDGESLVTAIEAEFQISIPDEAAEHIQTVGQCLDFVLFRTGYPRGGTCLSAASFYRLRRAIVDICGGEKRRVRPASRLDALFPGQHRRQAWQRLETAMGLRLPGMHPSPFAIAACTGMAIAVFISCSAFLLAIGSGPLGLVLAAFLGLMIMMIMGTITGNAFENSFPFETVGALSHHVAWSNYDELCVQTGQPTAIENSDVWERLRDIVCAHAGVEPEKVTYGTNFVNDLGAD
jgi:acyl carrier protein